MHRTCTCGAPARVRFSRTVPSGRWAREDRCDTCAAEFLHAINDGPGLAWEAAHITPDLLTAHAHIDARNRRGDTEADLLLMTFGSDY